MRRGLGFDVPEGQAQVVFIDDFRGDLPGDDSFEQRHKGQPLIGLSQALFALSGNREVPLRVVVLLVVRWESFTILSSIEPGGLRFTKGRARRLDRISIIWRSVGIGNALG